MNLESSKDQIPEEEVRRKSMFAGEEKHKKMTPSKIVKALNTGRRLKTLMLAAVILNRVK